MVREKSDFSQGHDRKAALSLPRSKKGLEQKKRGAHKGLPVFRLGWFRVKT
jgi:hypothetical protein